jgi:hypothetical protein
MAMSCTVLEGRRLSRGRHKANDHGLLGRRAARTPLADVYGLSVVASAAPVVTRAICDGHPVVRSQRWGLTEKLLCIPPVAHAAAVESSARAANGAPGVV